MCAAGLVQAAAGSSRAVGRQEVEQRRHGHFSPVLVHQPGCAEAATAAALVTNHIKHHDAVCDLAERETALFHRLIFRLYPAPTVADRGLCRFDTAPVFVYLPDGAQ